MAKIPDNFIVREFVPQLEVLKHTSVFISHAGLNSIHEGIHAKVPMILFPQAIEQEYITRKMKKLGCAAILSSKLKDEKVLRETVRQLINNKRMKENLEKLSKKIHLDALQMTGDLIEQYMNDSQNK